MRRRSFILIALLVLLSIGAGGFLSYRLIMSSIRNAALSNLRAFNDVAVLRYLSELEPEQAVSAIKGEAGMRATVIRQDGSVVADSEFPAESMENHLYRPEVQQALKSGSGWALRRSDTAGSDTLYSAVQLEDGSVLRLSVTLMSARAAAGGETAMIVLVAALLAAAGTAAAYAVSKGMNRKLERMARLSRELAGGDFTVRLPEGGDGAEAGLASSFNQMAERLSTTVGGLTRQKAELSGVLSSVAEGIVAVDKDFSVTLFNERAARILGAAEDAAPGSHLLERVRAPKLESALAEAQKTGDVSYYEDESAAGEAIAVAAAPIRMEDGTIAGSVASIRDISGAKKLELMRSEFVANVTHELKTPLTSIRGFAESLSAEEDKEVRVRFLSVIVAEADRMSKLIDDIIALSQIETVGAGGGPADLGEETKAAATALIPLAESKGIALRVNIEPGVMIAADPTTCRRLAVNLIDNALKYTQKGGAVEVRVGFKEGKAVLEVEDNGPGIAKEHQARVFERFYRVDASRSRQLGGTGLGLAIVKHIALSLGGQAKLESEPGKGSRFTIAVPISRERKT